MDVTSIVAVAVVIMILTCEICDLSVDPATTNPVVLCQHWTLGLNHDQRSRFWFQTQDWTQVIAICTGCQAFAPVGDWVTGHPDASQHLTIRCDGCPQHANGQVTYAQYDIVFGPVVVDYQITPSSTFSSTSSSRRVIMEIRHTITLDEEEEDDEDVYGESHYELVLRSADQNSSTQPFLHLKIDDRQLVYEFHDNRDFHWYSHNQLNQISFDPDDLKRFQDTWRRFYDDRDTHLDLISSSYGRVVASKPESQQCQLVTNHLTGQMAISTAECLTFYQSQGNPRGQSVRIDCSPRQIMYGNRVTHLLFRDSDRPTQIFDLDISQEKVVDQYEAHPDWHLGAMTQAYDDPIIVGINDNSVFSLDPRQQGKNKLAEYFSYQTPPRFTSVTTTPRGQVIVGSENGDLRLFTDLSQKAKSMRTGQGDPILHLDVNSSGTQVLVTTSTYLLLVGLDRGGFSDHAQQKLSLRPQDMINHLTHGQSLKPANFQSAKFIGDKFVVTTTNNHLIRWAITEIGMASALILPFAEDLQAFDQLEQSAVLARSRDVVSFVI